MIWVTITICRQQLFSRAPTKNRVVLYLYKYGGSVYVSETNKLCTVFIMQLLFAFKILCCNPECKLSLVFGDSLEFCFVWGCLSISARKDVASPSLPSATFEMSPQTER